MFKKDGDNVCSSESVLTLLGSIWLPLKFAENNNTDSEFLLQHYLAGDLYWEEELPLITWISKSGEYIGAIKLSHHGSESSSPTAVFSTLKPNSVIASAGTSHGHPRKAPPKLMETS